MRLHWGEMHGGDGWVWVRAQDPDRDFFTKEAAIVDRLKQDFKGAWFRWWCVIKHDIYLEDMILHFVENCCYSEGARLGVIVIV